MKKIIITVILLTSLLGCVKQENNENVLICSGTSTLSGITTQIDAKYILDDNENVTLIEQTSIMSDFAEDEMIERYKEELGNIKEYYEEMNIEFTIDVDSDKISTTIIIDYEKIDNSFLDTIAITTKEDAINFMKVSNIECSDS